MDVEKSLAIKCPSINSTLAGTKRVQQVIAKPGVLERWLDKPSADAIRDTFVGLYSFEVLVRNIRIYLQYHNCTVKASLRSQKSSVLCLSSVN